MCVIGVAGKGTFIERLPVSGAASFYVLRPIVNARPATAAVSLPLSVSLAAALIPHPLFPRSSLFVPAWPSTPPPTSGKRGCSRLSFLLLSRRALPLPHAVWPVPRSRETPAGYSLSLRFRCANEKSCQLNIASCLASVSRFHLSV